MNYVLGRIEVGAWMCVRVLLCRPVQAGIAVGRSPIQRVLKE